MMNQTENIALNINKNEAGRLVNFRPVFASVCFLLLGIFAGYFRVVEERLAIGWFIAALALPWCFYLFVNRKTRFFVYLFMFYFSFFLGLASFSMTVVNYRDSANYQGECYVTGTIVEKNIGDFGGEIVLTNLVIDGREEKGRLSVTMYEEDFVALEYCDKVTFWMNVRTVNNVNGYYGFRAEAIADRELFIGGNVDWYEVQGREFLPGAYIRGKLQSAIYDGMSEESAAIAVAILLGNTSGIESGLLQNIRYGGVAHIFAVSGLHIGAVFAFCLFLFRRNRVPAPIRFIAIAFALILYGGVCGYSASVIRAIVTCLVLYGCTLLGIKYDSLESLSLAAYIVFAIYPTLLFGVGAQLSFGACLGILLLSRPLQRSMETICFGLLEWIKYGLLRREREKVVDMFRDNTAPKPLFHQAMGKIISFLSVSIAAQVGTAPILYISFGYFSVASLWLNCMFVPIITLCFSPLLLLSVLATLIPVVASAILWVPNVLISGVMLLFHLIDFDGGIITSLTVGATSLICYYFAMILASDKFNIPKWVRCFAVMIFVAAFAACIFLFSSR
jgi:competence protein ComEC